MSLLAGLRERKSRGELSVELDAARARVVVLEQMAAAMIGCVKELVLDVDELGGPQLRADLADTLAHVRGGAGAPVLAEHTARRQADALDFAEREREYLARRDAELRHIIDVLTDGLAEVARGAAAYHKKLLDNGSRLETASRLADLVRMRAAITSEVAGLRAAVAERQAEEQRTTAALRQDIAALEARVATERTAARTDPLTGAANRAAFDEELARRCDLAALRDAPFAVLLADVDHFKQINDRHGHGVGDRVLTGLVAFLRERVRKDDLVARWGGEEFAVILPTASLRVAHRKARTLVDELARATWAIDEGRQLAFTISVGVAAWLPADDPAALMARADQALYAAKHGGRNRAIKAA